MIQTVNELKDENQQLSEELKNKELRLKEYDNSKEKEIDTLRQINAINTKTMQQKYQNELDQYIE